MTKLPPPAAFNLVPQPLLVMEGPALLDLGFAHPRQFSLFTLDRPAGLTVAVDVLAEYMYQFKVHTGPGPDDFETFGDRSRFGGSVAFVDDQVFTSFTDPMSGGEIGVAALLTASKLFIRIRNPSHSWDATEVRPEREGLCAVRHLPAMIGLHLEHTAPQTVTWTTEAVAVPEPAEWPLRLNGF